MIFDMTRSKYQFDETGEEFYFFVMVIYGLILLPLTTWVCRRKEKQDNKGNNSFVCDCEPCRTKNRRCASLREGTFKNMHGVLLVVGWIAFAWVAYRASNIKATGLPRLDPYAVLGIDQGSSDQEIRNAYRILSEKHRADRRGDEEAFRTVAKAYSVLAHEQSRRRWEEYGDPDGPNAAQYGIALPKGLVEGGTSICYLVGYFAGAIVILRIVTSLRWQELIIKDGDEMLLVTQKKYDYFIKENPYLKLKKALMILAASSEFWKKHNSEIVERPTDDEEMRQVMMSLPQPWLSENDKRKLLCFPYRVKACALLLAHMQRLPLPANTLQQDMLYIVNKCPLLINMMVNTVAQLVAMSYKGLAKRPQLMTLEAIMKMSPLLVQGLCENSSQLLMLPHISEQTLMHFTSNQLHIKNCWELCQLADNERRTLLHHLNDKEYQDIMNVLKGLPVISMICDVKVLDDEDDSITAKSFVTISVMLKRESMLAKVTSQLESPGEYFADDDGNGNEEEMAGVTPDEVMLMGEQSEQADARGDEQLDEDWEEFETSSENNCENYFISRVSHPVHCPYFPSEKQEYWWLYLCDEKNLLTNPVRITNLVDTLHADLKLCAPENPGCYLYTICLKSDSYVDMDISLDLMLNVKAAKIIQNHPQWMFFEEEQTEESSQGGFKSEYEYDSTESLSEEDL